LPPVVQALVQRAAVADAVGVTLETVRQTGELPPNVRSAARSFLSGRVAVLASEAVSAGERVPAFAAPGLAVWLEPQNRARLADLAFANDVLGRWCAPPTSGRHFAPLLCEPAALIAALRAANAKDPTAEALERAAQASDEITLGDGKVKIASADWADTSRPDERDLRVTLTAEGTAEPDATAVTLLAAGVPAIPGRATEDAPGTLVFRVPIRLVAPVLSIDGKLLRLPPAPFSR
jgi:hypothetical protein